MTTCPVCGTDNRAGARFCRHCRSALPATGQGIIKCRACGAVLRQGARFCKICGRPVHPAAQKPGEKCPFCGAPVSQNTYLCPACRRFLPAVHREAEKVAFPSMLSVPSAPEAGESPPLALLAGRYAVVERIAKGGMGAVYKAYDRRLSNKIVAVKEVNELSIAPSERAGVIEAFGREAALLATLEHPNLVHVTDSFREGTCHYLVMEYVDGHTLQELLEQRETPFDEEQVIVWADQLCDVLSYLHSQNPKIIYRDMKPANVMIVRGTDAVKLIDFGIARFYKPGRHRDTIQFGTEGYAPPEQYGSAQTDEQADIYALGATLHHLLTLHDPRNKPFYFPPVRTLNPRVSRQVEEAIARAVEVNKDKRFSSISEMRAALTGGRPRAAGRRSPARPALPASAGEEGGLPPSPATPVAEEATIDLGRVEYGALVKKARVTIPPTADQSVELRTTAPWLTVTPARITGHDREVTLTVHVTLLKPGKVRLNGWLKRCLLWPACLFVPEEREFSSFLELDDPAGLRRVPVRVMGAPSKAARFAGWFVAITFIIAELMALVVAGVLLLISGAMLFK